MNTQLIHEDHRRGVALIIVLGFLSIMIIMALAFLTQARVERLVSNASLEGMRTRQMAQTAIASGMQDYLNALKSIDQTDTEHDIFLSGDHAGNINYYYSGEIINDDRLMIGKVEDWVKAKHLDIAMGSGDPTDDIRNAEWIWVREVPRTRSRILGRYAYAVFDMSGLLDANLLGADYGDNVPEYGSSTNRNNVRRMVFEALDESSGGNQQLRLNEYRRMWRGFDTPAALLALTDGVVNDGDDNPENRWAGTDMVEKGDPLQDISALSPYSYAALHLSEGNTEKLLCTADSIETKDPQFFSDILAGADKADVIRAMRDYESPESTPPDGVDYPSIKNVPMFNEVAFQAELEETPAGVGTNGAPASTYNLILRMKVEFWYPFPSEKNQRSDSFSMAISSDISGGKAATGPNDIWVRMAGMIGGTLTELLPGAVASAPSGSLSVQADFNDGKPYFSSDGEDVVYTIPLTALNGDPLLPQNMQLVVRSIQMNGPLVLTSGGSPVDSTPSGDALEFVFSSPPLPNAAPTEWQSVAVDDPRLNHLRARWSIEDPPTPGVTNQAALDAKAQVAGIEPGAYMFCRNGRMDSPAELGYFSTGIPWETLDIFSEKGSWLMSQLVCNEDTFDLMETHKVYFTNGTINPYTRNTNVLNAAFYGLDIREVPEMTGDPKDTERMNGSDLTELVKAMMDEEAKKGRAGWATILDNKNLIPDLNKNNRISLLGNTFGLFSESDRVFVIVVVAQSIKESADEAGKGNWDPAEDMITGERRAVALCWLDGSADGSADTLTQEMNILMFQYLNE